MRATLIGNAGLVAGQEFELVAAVVTIGRRDENTTVIKEPTVSRTHAVIRWETDGLVIVDNGSTSGTLVNGQTITGPQRLQDGDTITIGNSASFAVRIALADSDRGSSRQEALAPSAVAKAMTDAPPAVYPTTGGTPTPTAGDFSAPMAQVPAMSERTRAEIIFSGPLPAGGEPQSYIPPSATLPQRPTPTARVMIERGREAPVVVYSHAYRASYASYMHHKGEP